MGEQKNSSQQELQYTKKRKHSDNRKQYKRNGLLCHQIALKQEMVADGSKKIQNRKHNANPT